MKRLSVLAAVVLVVLMVHAWGDPAVSVSPLVSCNPDCDGVEAGVQVADPKNCTQYYTCLNNIAYGPFDCGPNNHFDPESSTCASDSECTSICGPGAGCPLTCNDTLAEVGDAFNCSVYYVCNPGDAKPASCPANRPYYNGNTQLCGNDESVCCSGYCEPYCDGTAAVVPDPTDCKKFYFCDPQGEPYPDGGIECNGGYFSLQLGSCVVGDVPDPCPALCEATGGGDGSSSSGGGGADSTTPADGSTTPADGSTTPGDGSSTDINGCVSSLVCTAAGNFAACSTCQPEYFYCSGSGAMGVPNSCTDDTVFNPTPGYPYCVLPSNCPYP